MVYDCVSFFNEIDLLEARLNILWDVVDRFIIVESRITHSGQKKPLYFELNKEKFLRFSKKIVYIVVDDFPPDTSDWEKENIQRNAILQGLVDCGDNDLIVISDLDEIIKPEVITKCKELNLEGKVYDLELQNFAYYFNNINIRSPRWKGKAKIVRYDYIKNNMCRSFSYCGALSERFNLCTTPTKIRLCQPSERIENAGWHFSWLGGEEMVRNKLKSVANHGGKNDMDMNMIDSIDIEKIIKNGKDPFGRWYFSKYAAIPVVSSSKYGLPQYIVDNYTQLNSYFLHPNITMIEKFELFLFSHGLDVIRDTIIQILIRVRSAFSKKSSVNTERSK